MHFQINLPKTWFQSVIALLKTFQWSLFVWELSQMFQSMFFPVALYNILLHLSCILVNVSSHYSSKYTFVLAHISLFTWENLDFITVYFKGCLQLSREMSLLHVGFPYMCPFLYFRSIWFLSLLWHLSGLDNVYAIIVFTLLLHSQFYEIKIFI